MLAVQLCFQMVLIVLIFCQIFTLDSGALNSDKVHKLSFGEKQTYVSE